MNYATLYGVGVGPGAPDLMTLRAVDTLKRADVLALPRSSDYGASMAWKIIEPVVGKNPGQERLFLTFPMSKEPRRLRKAWDAAFAKIGEHLEHGRSVAFATEGDPSLYSTFGYLQREASQRWPGIRVEVVPGVSSVTAVPAITGTPLADGLERIAIIPANYGVEDLVATLNAFDTTILMKIGSEMPKVVAALERTGLLDKAVYVAKATMREQRVVTDVREVRTERGDCFAMIIVTRRERSGVLAGEVSPGAELAKVGA
ncbi:MAG TPA: precorrin-2 C(20)-methyltransferase [Candidatus Binataceae bacterium]|nr:precorrin-2 C(20)-methyltransferase [Candidatus Binataceae bacterium]